MKEVIDMESTTHIPCLVIIPNNCTQVHIEPHEYRINDGPRVYSVDGFIDVCPGDVLEIFTTTDW